MRNEILIYNKTTKRVPEKFIKTIILGVLDFLKLKQPTALAVLIMTPFEIKKLNKIWRHKNETPDELSFGLNSHRAGAPDYQRLGFAKNKSKVLELGEIAINSSKIYNKSYLAKILIHSFLHLLGYNHEKSVAEAEKMELLEKRILKNLEIRN